MDSARCVISGVTGVQICCLELPNTLATEQIASVSQKSVATDGWALGRSLRGDMMMTVRTLKTAHEQFNDPQAAEA